MPEPNLPPLIVNIDKNKIEGLINVEELKALMPELPEVTRQKLKEKYGLPMELILQLVVSNNLLIKVIEYVSLLLKNLLVNLLMYD